MTDKLIEAVARAIRDELFDGTENKPPVGAETPAHGMARAAIAAIEAAGYRIVPLEPTFDMKEAAYNEGANDRVWPAILAAAPKVLP